MISVSVTHIAEPLRDHLSMLKQYASVADNSRDALLLSLLKTAMVKVGEAADVTLLPARLSLCVSEREENAPVRLYQSPKAIISVKDGEGMPLEYTLDGNILLPAFYSHTIVVDYETEANCAQAQELMPVVYRYATALYDGADSATLNSILAEC